MLRLQARLVLQGWGDSFWQNLGGPRLAAHHHLLVVSIAPDLRLFRTFVLDEINQDYVAHRASQGRVGEPDQAGTRSAQRVDPDHHPRHGSGAGPLIGAFLIERLFDSGIDAK
jgi:peptide/nickel transport system permease protein